MPDFRLVESHLHHRQHTKLTDKLSGGSGGSSGSSEPPTRDVMFDPSSERELDEALLWRDQQRTRHIGAYPIPEPPWMG